MKEKMSSPPRWAQCLLTWYCRPELVEDLQGDLNEYFDRNCKAKGVWKAKLIYIIDVIKFFRSYTVRKPEFINLLIHWLMLGSYIKTSGRSIVRNKLFSFINITGLAISMSVGLLMVGLLSDMSAYDKFHEHYDHIYRVVSKYKYLDNEDSSFYASTSLRTGKMIEESVTGIEKMTVMHGGFRSDIKAGDKILPLEGFWADESFFSVFTFPLVSGNPATALKEPHSIVLTESAARKLFGNADPMGKSVTTLYRKHAYDYTVTAVMKDLPVFSHMRFNILASLSTRTITEKENKDEMAWDNMWNGYVYLVLPENADLQNLQTTLNTLSVKEDQTVKNTSIKLALQPLSEIALGEDMNNSPGPIMGERTVWVIGILSFVVILSACFNYTNLSIARAMRRSREVGIRKVVGALKRHVLTQFVTEAMIIALLALVIAFGFFVLLKPYFLSLDYQYREMLVLDVSPKVAFYFVLLAIGTGIMAGFFPALFFSRINAIKVLKNITVVRGFRSLTMRKVLIVAQFTISLMFIAATITGYKHYKQILAFDLGFNTENILNINLFNNKADLMAKELMEMPEVKELSRSALITSVGNYWGTTMKYNNPLDSANINFNTIDERYIPLHGHKLIAGRNFRAGAPQAEEHEIIVNEQALRRFNIGGGDPQKALGEKVIIDKHPLEIIGVMKDFQYGRSTDQEVREVVFRYITEKNNSGYINAKVISTDWPATLAKIEKAWEKVDNNVHRLDAVFYDDQIERAFSDLSARLKIIGALAFLAICIAAIGLLGMVVFTTETRLKEISIRKVLGAGEGSLIYLLSRGFLVLLAIAALIALPATHYFFAEVALAEYSGSAPAAYTELAFGLTAVMVLALLMIGAQTIKVARANPAEVLKSE